MNLKRKSPAKTKKYMIAIKTAMDANITTTGSATSLYKRLQEKHFKWNYKIGRWTYLPCEPAKTYLKLELPNLPQTYVGIIVFSSKEFTKQANKAITYPNHWHTLKSVETNLASTNMTAIYSIIDPNG